MIALTLFIASLLASDAPIGVPLDGPSFTYESSLDVAWTTQMSDDPIDTGNEGTDRRWVISPYFWFSGIDGSVTVGGNRVSGSVSFSDLLENLDMGLIVHVEHHRKGWTIFFDNVVMWLSDDLDRPANSEVSMSLAAIELGGAFPIFGPDQETWQTPLTIEGLVGFRYIYLDQEVEIGSFEADHSDQFIDPFFGGRGMWSITDAWSLTARGDIGGFGIGSKLSWQVAGMVQWQTLDWLTVALGYRLLDIDWSTGGGTGEHGLDVQFSGPFLGASFSF